MAIQSRDKKPSLSLDPRMQSVALGPRTNNEQLCSGKIIEDLHTEKYMIPSVVSDTPRLHYIS